MEILLKTLEKMPYNFSSNQFSEVARRKGLSPRQIANGIIPPFLQIHALRGETKRMWYKKKSVAIDLAENLECAITGYDMPQIVMPKTMKALSAKFLFEATYKDGKDRMSKLSVILVVYHGTGTYTIESEDGKPFVLSPCTINVEYPAALIQCISDANQYALKLLNA